MSVDTRRAVVIAVVIIAIVALVLVIRTLTGLMPQAPPRETGASGAPPLAPATPAMAAPVPPAVDTPDPSPPPTDLSSYDRDLDLFGVVLDHEGAPVFDATVQALFLPRGMTRAPMLGAAAVRGPATRSGPDGAFGIRLLRGQKAALRVTADEFAPYEGRPEAAGSRLVVVLRPAVSCVVTVRDSARRPVAGLPVRLLRPAYRSAVVFDRMATSDPDGRARFDDLPGGLTAEMDPALRWPVPGTDTQVLLPLRGTLSLEVSLPPGRTIRGRVTDDHTGSPIPGARVRLSYPTGGQATTDADGRYSLDGVPEPPSREAPFRHPAVEVSAEGYVAGAATVREGDRCDVRLGPAATLTGRVVDRGGAPIPVAWVFVGQGMGAGARPGARDDWAFAFSATTDVEGRFRVSVGARQRSLRIEAIGFAPLERAVEWPGTHSGALDLGDLVPSAGRMLEGRVLDAEGHPIPEARVTLDDEDCATNDLGRFRFRDLAPGPHVLRAVAKGRDQVQRRVTLSPDRDPTVFDLSFPAGREVTIDVRDVSGAPVVGAGLDVVGRRIWETTDVRGRGAVIVPPGPWTVRVAAGRHRYADGRPVFVPREAALPVDATFVVVTLDRAPLPEEMLRITGTVVDDEGRPVEGAILAVVWQRPADPSRQSTDVRSRAGGVFSVEVPKGAVCDIRALAKKVPNAPPSMGEPRDPWEGESNGVPAGASDVTVLARPDPQDRTLTVLALSPEGEPLAGGRVTLSGPLGHDAHARTGKDGRALLSRLFRASYSASVDPPDGRRGEWLPGFSGSFVPHGQEITIRLPRAAHIAGIVLLPDGSPARGAYVTCTSGSTRRDEWVDASGRFRLAVDAALPLPWRLRAALQDDWPPVEVSVDLASPPTEDVTLRLVDTMGH